jgi:hypothetical protein
MHLRLLLVAGMLATLFGCGDSSGPDGQGNSFSFDDPAEDTVFSAPTGSPRALDALRVEGTVADNTVELTLTFATPVTPWSSGQDDVLDGFVDFDLDQNQATGIQAAIDESGGNAGMGVEYYISLRDVEPGNVALVNVQNQTTYVPVPVTFDDTRVIIEVPLSELNDDDGNFGLSAVVGTADRPVTDFLPNEGHYEVD